MLDNGEGGGGAISKTGIYSKFMASFQEITTVNLDNGYLEIKGYCILLGGLSMLVSFKKKKKKENLFKK